MESLCTLAAICTSLVTSVLASSGNIGQIPEQLELEKIAYSNMIQAESDLSIWKESPEAKTAWKELQDDTLKQQQKNQQSADEVTMPPQPEKNHPSVGQFDKKSWWFVRNQDHVPPRAQQDINISQYDAYYLGDVSQKNIYLTFDEGYENGNTAKILDILKDHQVPAAFFVTESYIKSEPDLVKRMELEGHIVGNHSSTHPDMSGLTAEKISAELSTCAAAHQEVTGKEMPPYFRPPEGAYSIHSLEETQKNGYKTIFWSFAYKDWDTKAQPGKAAAYQMVVDNVHNGAIMLLHAVSDSNTEALDDMIKYLKENGYVFRTLDQLPERTMGEE